MSSVNVSLSTDGNAPRHFGLYLKHLDNKRKAPHVGHIIRQITVNGVDCGLWTVDSQTLVLAANTNYAKEIITLASLGLSTALTITQVLDTGSSLTPAQDGFTFTSVGSGGFIVG